MNLRDFLVPPANTHDEYVPPRDVLYRLPDPRNYPTDMSFPPSEQFEVETGGPVLYAATIKDIRVLQGLLRHGFPPTNYIVGPRRGPWESSIIKPILAGPEYDSHVKLLIESGGAPDGFPLHVFQDSTTRFLRGREIYDSYIGALGQRSRSQALEDVEPAEFRTHQDMSITELEIQDRRETRSRFWAETKFPSFAFPISPPLHALSAAIKTQNTELYEYLVSHGADESAWKDQEKYKLLTEDLSASYFAVESPMLVSIQNEDAKSMEFLLSRGHKPDTFNMVYLTRCMSPLMATLAKPHPWLEGFNMLAPHADLSLLTPIFQCHALHFAVATHNLPLIQRVIAAMGGPAAAQAVAPTALGHTLLHIASLPIDDSVVNMHSKAIWSSIHDFRTLDEKWEPQHLTPIPPLTQSQRRGRGRGSPSFVRSKRGTLFARRIRNAPSFRTLSTEEHASQAAVIWYLIRSESVPRRHLVAPDIHGNIALHYLVSLRSPDYQLIDELRGEFPGDLEAFGHRNVFGYSAEDLLDDGEIAQQEFQLSDLAPFWDDENTL